ncbi:MAG: 3-deoxy-D-manno-octulosonic acid transferase [Bacteroidota bacterium]|nr:3-deoxy-D-manno-octulosonic acid transferase [Bacteroidota bacterium]MDX5429753.1 3-deoxy-D-manno-octulosonic acid transferase [Bacteroidota bacterium]MDX5468532.1 3-deoxy-D-manno-octulosonic acid transferase [Bacteroidota bacterium]
MRIVYHIATAFYRLGIGLASLRSEKAKKWIAGRKDWRSKLPGPKKGKRYWFHCASLGEFEQARPLIDHYSKEGISVCITFFSPSGFEQRQDYAQAEWVGYLPFDGRRNAEDFLNALQPDRVFFVKYEFWYQYLKACATRQIPLFLVSARFRSSQVFFKSYGGFYRSLLTYFTHIFTQDEVSVSLLKNIGVNPVSFAGDTRFDRVAQLPLSQKEFPDIERFCAGLPTLMIGSSWPPEEALVEEIIEAYPDWKWIIVPHEVGDENIQRILTRFEGYAVRYSQLNSTDFSALSVLVIDQVGMLGQLYRLADLVMVGGGFANALHNILEPAAWGKPVLFGPDTRKYPEGEELIQAGGAFQVKDAEDLKTFLEKVEQGDWASTAGEASRHWIQRGIGAATKIMEQVESLSGTK